MSETNYVLLVLSCILCGIGLTLGFVFFEPFGFMLDGLGFMLFLYVIATRNKDKTSAEEEAVRREEWEKEIRKRDKEIRMREATIGRKDIWTCLNCGTINLNENKWCYHCKQIKPIDTTKA